MQRAELPAVGQRLGRRLPHLYALAPLAVGYVFSRLYPVRFLPPAAADLLGGLLLALWLAVTVPAILTFRRARTSINPMAPSTALVVTGPFRFTRNPLYLGLVFGYSGVSILTQAWWAFVLLPVVLVVMQRAVIEREERYLERKFGEDYIRYKERVRRWL